MWKIKMQIVEDLLAEQVPFFDIIKFFLTYLHVRCILNIYMYTEFLHSVSSDGRHVFVAVSRYSFCV